MAKSDANNLSTASCLLNGDVWYECMDARLLRASAPWEQAPEFRAHGHALRRLFVDLHIDAILSVDGRLSVCIKDARALSSHQVEVLRRQLWNLGATTLLLVESQNDIKVFSTMAKPTNSDLDGSNALLPNETIQNLETVELALHMRELVRRIETGAIYLEHKPLFDAQSAVDRSLLENLKQVRNLICPKLSTKGYQRAHALIGRFLFSCYLLDRGIIRKGYLKKADLPEAEDILELLQAATDAPKVLTLLFKTLQRDFNGSLFGNLLDDSEIGNEEVDYLRRFLSGENLRTGQLSLFRLYNFGFIPVEFISSIYEDFLGAEAEAEAAERKPGIASRVQSQRSQGAYYTPPRLAELAVDIATEGWTTLLDKCCLDPACGSGVFLVILFIRMAEEWRMRNPTADTHHRYNELLRLLSDNLCGIDVHPTACLVTCFSLYLAFLDQMEPKEIIELRDALERDTRAKILPRILWEHNRPRPRSPHFGTVRELDFFVLPAEKEFDLVIGNPPWVSRKPVPNAETWLFSAKDNPYLKTIKQAEQSQILIPAHELACAFMWKAGLHLSTAGRVCQVLPSRVFLSNNTDSFQANWLKNHRLETVWLLADWRFILFPSADCPCFITRYHPRAENEALGNFEFITPKVELIDPRQALIPVLPEDQKTLSEVEIVSAATRREAAAAWKKQHWGTGRDVRLVERLLRMPRLKRIAKRPPRDPDSLPPDRVRWWLKGQGFRPATESTEEPKKVFWKSTDLFLPADSPVLDLLLLREHCRPIGELYQEEGLDRARSTLLYVPPLVLINKACTKVLFSNFPVLFQDDFQSICGPQHEEDELLFLTAVLSSPLAQYLLFHTTANIGIERDIARLEEILELPFPLPEDMPNPQASERILRSCARRLRILNDDLNRPENLLHREALLRDARDELNGFVFKYFQICDWERHLIKDTVEIFRPSSTPGSLDSDKLFTARPSTRAHRKEYAETLVKTFRGWSRTKRRLWASTSVAETVGLAVITFGVGDKSKPYAESASDGQLDHVLAGIRRTSAQDGTLFSRLRGFVLYEVDRVHVLKPLNRRHWTRTAALNDADEILGRMMEEDGWGG